MTEEFLGLIPETILCKVWSNQVHLKIQHNHPHPFRNSNYQNLRLRLSLLIKSTLSHRHPCSFKPRNSLKNFHLACKLRDQQPHPLKKIDHSCSNHRLITSHIYYRLQFTKNLNFCKFRRETNCKNVESLISTKKVKNIKI